MDGRTAANRRDWDEKSDGYQSHHGPRMEQVPIGWGTWRIPEQDLGLLEDVSGKAVLEIGCGAGHFVAGLTGLGARGIGLDLSQRQLVHAAENAAAVGVPVPFVNADGTRLPFRNDSFDVVCSDHGAVGWADPRAVIPEVARVLRPGGLLVFAGSTPLHSMCWDEESDRLDVRLHAPHEDVRVSAQPGGGGGVQLSHGETLRLLVGSGFRVEDLVELRAPSSDAITTWPWLAPVEWAVRWPTDEVWKARLA